MKKKYGAGLAFLLAAIAMPVLAQEGVQEMRPYLDGGYSYSFADSNRKSDAGQGAYLGGGFAINQYWGLEISGFWDSFNADGAAKPNSWHQYGGKVDGMFFYSRNPSFSPYVGVGVGGARNELRNTGDASTDAFVDAGVGFFKYFAPSTFFGDSLGLHADVR